jgi:uncharacterized integral membrane protein
MGERTGSGPDERLEVDRMASREEEEEAQVVEAAASPRRRRSGETQSWLAAIGATRFLLALVLVAVAIVGCVVLLGAGKWWALPIVVVVLLASFGLGAFMTLRATTEVEKPAPETVARLEEEGVPDPEGAANERVGEDEQKAEVTPSPSSRPVGRGQEGG